MGDYPSAGKHNRIPPCPECGADNYAREKRPNGNTRCLICGFQCSSREWDVAAASKYVPPEVDGPTKAYVVVEIGWEYNDENYHRPECGGGQPVKAFRRKEAAEAEAYRRNKEWAAKQDDYDRFEGGATIGFEVVEVELDDE